MNIHAYSAGMSVYACQGSAGKSGSGSMSLAACHWRHVTEAVEACHTYEHAYVHAYTHSFYRVRTVATGKKYINVYNYAYTYPYMHIHACIFTYKHAHTVFAEFAQLPKAKTCVTYMENTWV